MKIVIVFFLIIISSNRIFSSVDECNWEKKLIDCSRDILNYEINKCDENDQCSSHPVNSLMKSYIIWMQLLEAKFLGESKEYFNKLFELEQIVDRSISSFKEPDILNKENDLFIYGVFLNFKARIYFLEGRRIYALKAANESNKIFTKLIEKEPSFYDAYFYIGMYNYIVDSLPTLAKLIRIILLLPSGDKKKGLQQIKLAAYKGKYIKEEALLLLAVIYQYEQKNYDEAYKIISKLNKDYPNNPWFNLWMVFYKDYIENKTTEAEKNLLNLAENTPPSLKGTNFNKMIDYYLAENYIRQLKYDKAISILVQLDNNSKENPLWLTISVYFYLAYLYEEIGNYKASKINYEKILNLPDLLNYHRYAKKALSYLKNDKNDKERYDFFKLHNFIQDKRWAEAEKIIKKLERVSNPKNELFEYYNSLIFFERGDYNKSLNLFKTIANRDFKYYWLEPLVYIRIGDIYYKIHQLENALTYYNKAKEKDIIFPWEKWHLEYRIFKIKRIE